jgi:hypothetical protein
MSVYLTCSKRYGYWIFSGCYIQLSCQNYSKIPAPSWNCTDDWKIGSKVCKSDQNFVVFVISQGLMWIAGTCDASFHHALSLSIIYLRSTAWFMQTRSFTPRPPSSLLVVMSVQFAKHTGRFCPWASLLPCQRKRDLQYLLYFVNLSFNFAVVK